MRGLGGWLDGAAEDRGELMAACRPRLQNGVQSGTIPRDGEHMMSYGIVRKMTTHGSEALTVRRLIGKH